MSERYFGKYSGIVKDNRDGDNLGRLAVSVPALFPAEETVTARPALPYGVFFVPEVDAKVWVEFEGGDSGLPLWTGIQYVAGEWPQEVPTDPPRQRAIKTPAGHLLVFDDDSSTAGVSLTDGANGHRITLDAQGVQVEDGVSGHRITLDSGGVGIEDGVNRHALRLEAGGITIETPAGTKVQLTAAGVTIDAGAGLVEVKGSMVKLTGAASLGLAVLRANVDMGVGNLGAPVPLIGPGNPTVTA